MLKLKSSLHWGPFPNELTGGAVVQYLLLNKMYLKAPMHNFYGIPKNIEKLSPEEMSYIKFFAKEPHHIPKIMSRYHIPLLVAFHIAQNIEPAINPVHDVGAKILLHQTVHFRTDLLFECDRLNDVDWIVTPTKYGKKILNEIGKVSKEKISIIPHGIDIKKYYSHTTSMKKYYNMQNKTVILFTGRLSVWKGIREVIPLFRDFTKKYNCVFLIRSQPYEADESKALDYLLRKISSQNPDVVYMPDWQSPSVMEELFASIDILLTPSGSEGFNVPLIEAMACEVPVITTSLPNHVEIVGGTEGGGIFVQPKIYTGWADKQTKLKVASTDDLYEALKYLVENPEERKIMGKRGRERVLKCYDLDKITLEWFRIMDELIPENYSMTNKIIAKMSEK